MNCYIRKQTDKINNLIYFIVNNSLPLEDWKEINWTDEKYFISNKGRIISLCNKQPRLLKPFVCNDYYYVSICGRDRRINRLVAQHFIDNPEEKKIVHHIDGNKLNNDYTNLKWVSHKENTQAYYEAQKKKDNE